jgi:hypothetical protein
MPPYSFEVKRSRSSDCEAGEQPRGEGRGKRHDGAIEWQTLARCERHDAGVAVVGYSLDARRRTQVDAQSCELCSQGSAARA